MSRSDVLWLDEPEDHDYIAARTYLSLFLAPGPAITDLIAGLHRVDIVWYEAKDILRASTLPLLPEDNEHVAKDLKKVHAGKKLSPILLVRGSDELTVADGYHRICASWYADENTEVPVKII